jgi:hypothetical protein
MTGVIRGRVPVELSADPRFAGRVRRLAATATVALGLIWLSASLTLEAGWMISAALLAGWALMPTVLLSSLRQPLLRYALVVPAGLVGTGLLAICLTALPPMAVAAAGWVLVTAGVALGGVMGSWFWFRLVPVPAALDDPFSTARLRLIGLHIGLIVVGLALAAIPLVG